MYRMKIKFIGVQLESILNYQVNDEMVAEEHSTGAEYVGKKLRITALLAVTMNVTISGFVTEKRSAIASARI